MNIDALIDAFSYGVDYGLLLAEQERDGEDLGDAILCYQHARKFCLPSTISPRRQPRSDNWRHAKNNSVLAFIKLYAENSGGERDD